MTTINKTTRVHTLQDELLKTHVILAKTSTPTFSGALDVGQEGGIDEMLLNIHVPVTTLATGKKATLNLEHSVDGTTWKPVEGVSYVVTAKTAGGTDEQSFSFAYPVNAGRYIRLATVSEASSGVSDNTTVNFFITI